MINLTENAIAKIKSLAAKMKESDLALKLIVKGESCSECLVKLSINSVNSKSDKVYDVEGIKIAVSRNSVQKVENSTIDYSSDFMARGFKFLKPNGRKSCNC